MRQPRTISEKEARDGLAELLDSVERRIDAVVIERDGKPIGSLVSTLEYERLVRYRAEGHERLGTAIDRAQANDEPLDDEDVMAFVTEEIRQVREARRLNASK